MSPTPTFTGVQLRANNPTALAEFYCAAFGMSAQHTRNSIALSFAEGGVLQFSSATNGVYETQRGDRYWKIGITVPDLDLAVRQLKEMGVEVSTPQQFLNIGYLSHLQDPEGFTIELLQHTFLEQRPTPSAIDSAQFGGGARLAHITLRTHDIESELAHFCGERGMTQLSRQPVPEYGFSLYFLAHTNEQPPNSNLESIANRPWLCQRPYPLLELQSFERDTELLIPAESQPGFAGLLFSQNTPVTLKTAPPQTNTA